MDDVTRRNLDSSDRCATWFADFSAGVGNNGKLKDLKANFLDKLAVHHTTVGERASAVSESEEQTGVKGTSREDCVKIAVKVNRAAKAAEIEQPGIQARYPYPRNLNDESLVALLRSYAIGGATDEAIIAAYGAPADWVSQCTAKADGFEAASAAQDSAQGGKVGKRALIHAQSSELRQMVRTAGYIIENVFADDIEALTRWKSAAHVESPPKPKKPKTPKPPTP